MKKPKDEILTEHIYSCPYCDKPLLVNDAFEESYAKGLRNGIKKYPEVYAKGKVDTLKKICGIIDDLDLLVLDMPDEFGNGYSQALKEVFNSIESEFKVTIQGGELKPKEKESDVR
jgi:hypothetical protein